MNLKIILEKVCVESVAEKVCVEIENRKVCAKNVAENVVEFVCGKWKMENGKETQQKAESVSGYVA